MIYNKYFIKCIVNIKKENSLPERCTWGSADTEWVWTGWWSFPPPGPICRGGRLRTCTAGRRLHGEKKKKQHSERSERREFGRQYFESSTDGRHLPVMTAVWFSPQDTWRTRPLLKCSTGLGSRDSKMNVPWPSWPNWPRPNVNTSSSEGGRYGKRNISKKICMCLLKFNATVI